MRRIPGLTALALAAAACSTPAATTSSQPVFTTAPTTTLATTTSTTRATTTTVTTTTTTTTSATSAATTTTTTLPPEPELVLAEAASGFTAPLFVTAPAGDDRLFVVEQDGHVQVLRGSERLGAFLDVSGLVSFGGERGLLGLAFHPGYAENGLLYVDYTDRRGDTVVAEYRVSADPDRADPLSGRVLLTIPQPRRNHNGGMTAFGPDGYLYVGMGDGGGSGDPERTGQDPTSLLGAILRIDPAGDPYAVPGNPWAAEGGAPEVWAKGLRNPWRFSFDDGLIYIGDVGQDAWEEIDVEPIGSGRLNFGWSIMEGTHCFREEGCDTTGLTFPVLEYSHEEGHCSVTGGYVYRGQAIPELEGTYFYGDYCSGVIWSFRIDLEGIYDMRLRSDTLGAFPGLTSFGLDGAGELYAVTQDGTVYRLQRG
jgi:glucose/arabinose dehydrogenase